MVMNGVRRPRRNQPRVDHGTRGPGVAFVDGVSVLVNQKRRDRESRAAAEVALCVSDVLHERVDQSCGERSSGKVHWNRKRMSSAGHPNVDMGQTS